MAQPTGQTMPAVIDDDLGHLCALQHG